MTDDVRIVVGHRGWVWVGYWSQDPRNPDEILLSRSRTVIRWGTAGLGIEALHDGPREGATELSKSGVNRRLHRLAIVDCFEVSAKAWAKHLAVSK